jgi:hypothetical protein
VLIFNYVPVFLPKVILYALGAVLQGRANFFMDDLPYPLCSTLPGLKQEMGPPVLHIRYTMSGEAAI